MFEKTTGKNPYIRERNAIEQIIKDKISDRAVFREVNKFDYRKIITRIYYAFFDMGNPDRRINLICISTSTTDRSKVWSVVLFLYRRG